MCGYVNGDGVEGLGTLCVCMYRCVVSIRRTNRCGSWGEGGEGEGEGEGRPGG
jgi:hypothetical protein